MPANIYADMNANSGGGLEDHRALQLAFELSLLGLNGDDDGAPSTSSPPHSNSPTSLEDAAARKRSANMTECVPVPSSEHVAEIVGRQGERKQIIIYI